MTLLIPSSRKSLFASSIFQFIKVQKKRMFGMHFVWSWDDVGLRWKALVKVLGSWRLGVGFRVNYNLGDDT